MKCGKNLPVNPLFQGLRPPPRKKCLLPFFFCLFSQQSLFSFDSYPTHQIKKCEYCGRAAGGDIPSVRVLPGHERPQADAGRRDGEGRLAQQTGMKIEKLKN